MRTRSASSADEGSSRARIARISASCCRTFCARSSFSLSRPCGALERRVELGADDVALVLALREEPLVGRGPGLAHGRRRRDGRRLRELRLRGAADLLGNVLPGDERIEQRPRLVDLAEAPQTGARPELGLRLRGRIGRDAGRRAVASRRVGEVSERRLRELGAAELLREVVRPRAVAAARSTARSAGARRDRRVCGMAAIVARRVTN